MRYSALPSGILKYPPNRQRPFYASGLSMAAMMSLVFFGTLSLQCAINTFGQDIIVAHTAARKITEFFMLPFSVMGVTMANYCGQNTGAGRMDRIRGAYARR